MAIVKPSLSEKPKAEPVELKLKTQELVEFLLHPYTGQAFTSEPVKVEAMDGWLQSQIDAGKLVQC